MLCSAVQCKKECRTLNSTFRHKCDLWRHKDYEATAFCPPLRLGLDVVLT